RRRHTRFSRDWSSDVCSSDLPEFLPGDLDLHAIGMGHRIRFLAQGNQRSGNTASNIIKGQITHLARGVAQAVSHLLADGKQDFWMFEYVFIELFVTDFCYFAVVTCPAAGAARFLGVEKTHLTKKVTRVEIGHNDFSAIQIIQCY